MSDNPNPQQGDADAGQDSKTEPRKYAGKYDSPDALEKGYNEQARGYSTLASVLREREAELAALKSQMQQGEVAKQNDERQRKIELLREAGIDPEVLREVVQDTARETSRTEAQAVANKRLKPAEDAAAAFNAISPEYQAEASRLLASDPAMAERYRRYVSSDPEMAGQMLEQEIKIRRMANPQPQPKEGDDRPGRLKRVVDASVVPGSGRGSDDVDDNPDNQRRLQILKEQQKRGGMITKKFACDFLDGTIDVWEEMGKPMRRI